MGRDLDEVVDIRSGLAYLLVKWKPILLAALIGAVIGGCFGHFKSPQAQTEAGNSYEETIRRAKEACSDEGALYAEQLSAQYKAYNSELSRWAGYLEHSALQNLDPYSYVRKELQYTVVSDNANAVSAFSESLLGREEQESIGKILGVDPAVASPGEVIVIRGAGRVSTAQMQNEEVGVRTEITNSMGEVHREILSVSVAAGDQAQADAIGAIVDKAVTAKGQKLQAGGAEIKITKTDEVTTANDAGWLLNRQQEVLNNLVSFQINYSLFIKNSADILQGSQKTYYEMLISLDPEEAVSTNSGTVSSAKTAVKYAAVGGAAGLALALVCAYLLFVFSAKVQTGEQLRNNQGLSVLERFRTGEIKKWDVIKNYGLSVLGMDRAAQITEEGAASLRAELERMTAQSGKKRVYLTYDCTGDDTRSSVETLAGLLSGDSLTVIAGNPLAGEEDRRKLLETDLVVTAEVLGVSRSKALGDLLEICRRNELPVAGCVTVLDIDRY